MSKLLSYLDAAEETASPETASPLLLLILSILRRSSGGRSVCHLLLRMLAGVSAGTKTELELS